MDKIFIVRQVGVVFRSVVSKHCILPKIKYYFELSIINIDYERLSLFQQFSSFYFAGRCISLIHHSTRLVIRRDAGSSPKWKNAYYFYSSRRKQLLYVIIIRDRGIINALTLVSRVLSINTFNNMDLDP